MRPLDMSNDSETFTNSQRRRIFWILFTILGAILMFITGCLGVGRWLVVEDQLEKAGAILILSGRMPMRAIEAARLYHGGYGPEVWLTRPGQPAASLQSLHIAYLGEDFYNTRVLMHEGVPATAVVTLE